MLFSSCFCQKNTHKTHEIVKVAVINDNNNFAPSLFRSLCEFVGDCFGPRYFSSGAALPQKNTSVQNNHLRFHTMTSKKMVRSYHCLTIISIMYIETEDYQTNSNKPEQNFNFKMGQYVFDHEAVLKIYRIAVSISELIF